MTLEDAIIHCDEAAKRLHTEEGCESCAKEHEQLSGWLRELAQFRKEAGKG